MTARYSIGIDLGTTASALAYVPLADDAQARVLTVAQWEAADALVEATTLPSFLCFPEDALATQLRGKVPETQGWIVGRLVKSVPDRSPERFAHSRLTGANLVKPGTPFNRSGILYHGVDVTHFIG